MSKIRVVALMKWPVANSKINREKTTKNLKMAQKILILEILKNALEFYFILSQGPTMPNNRIPRHINVGRVLSPTFAYYN